MNISFNEVAVAFRLCCPRNFGFLVCPFIHKHLVDVRYAAKISAPCHDETMKQWKQESDWVCPRLKNVTTFTIVQYKYSLFTHASPATYNIDKPLAFLSILLYDLLPELRSAFCCIVSSSDKNLPLSQATLFTSN